MSRTVVIAIGGNSLIKDPQHMSVPDQYRALGETSGHIAAIIRDGWNVAIGHGNGPQVGFIRAVGAFCTSSTRCVDVRCRHAGRDRYELRRTCATTSSAWA